MPPGMTFSAPNLSIEVPTISTPLPPSNINTHAGKKHISTPPPPPIPPRSHRRPTKAASTTVSSSSSSPSSTDLEQRVKLLGHVPGSGSEQSRDAAAEIARRRSSQNMTERSDTPLPCFQQLPLPPPQQQQLQRQQNHFSQAPRKPQVLDDIDREASNVCEFIKDRLYLMWTSINPISTHRTTYVTIDNYLQYAAFFSDFGPFDIADVFRFCCLMKERLELVKMQGKILCLYSKPEDDRRANAAFAICCYMMLLYNKTPEEAHAPIEHAHPPITPYRDASSGSITYTLSILDCLRGLRKGLDLGLLRLDQFDVKEYEHYERVSNGDFNWITPFFIAFAGPRDKITYTELKKYQKDAATPSALKRRTSRSKPKSGTTTSRCNAISEGGNSSEPESTGAGNCSEPTASESSSTVSSDTTPLPSPDLSDCNDNKSVHKEGKTRRKRKKHCTRLSKSFQSVLDYFKTHDVKCVIRLNHKTYDEEHFQTLGMDHVDLIYPDGSCPPWYIVEQFLSTCEELILDTGNQEEQTAEGGVQQVRIKKGRVVAVHCMAGLGRTGTLIGVFLMRHFDMTAREVIAFLRLMRPGSVVGPQQNWLAQNEYRIRNRNWGKTQSRKLEGCRQKLRRIPRSSDALNADMKAQADADFEAISPTHDTRLIPDSPSISLTPTSIPDYEQIFSRANSEGFESTQSKTDIDSESESEFETLDSPIEVFPEGEFSSELGNESTFQIDESDLRDVDSATVGDCDEAMSTSTEFDTSDEDCEGSSEYHAPIPVNHPHARSAPSASLIGPSSLGTSRVHQRPLLANNKEIYSAVMSASDFIPEKMDADLISNNVDGIGKEMRENTVDMADQLQPQSLGMEHIGDREYAIPVQPRKQQHTRIENSGSDALSSDGSTPPGPTPFSNLTLQSGIKHNNDGAYVENATLQRSQAGEKLRENRFFDGDSMGDDDTDMDSKTSTVLLPDKTPFDYIRSPPSPPSFNNDDDDNSSINADAMVSPSEMTTIQVDVKKPSITEWSGGPGILHSCEYRQHKSSRGLGL
ncbi:Dual specificity protein phosphatase cdc14a [Entomortierella chlamydospora]|nr:Dual specificity protein phosphatase cdc14a [Entomortierella chlamydospora]